MNNLQLVAKVNSLSGINELTYLLEQKDFVKNIIREMLDDEFYMYNEENLIAAELITGKIAESDYDGIFNLAIQEDGSDDTFRIRTLQNLQICSIINPCSAKSVEEIFSAIDLFDC